MTHYLRWELGLGKDREAVAYGTIDRGSLP